MIIELPNSVSKNDTAFIREAVRPFLQNQKHAAFNRDGRSIDITKTSELHKVDAFLSKLFCELQTDVVSQRYRPPSQCESGDSGYEYHMYAPGDVCHFHADHEFHSSSNNTLLRYASVVLHLNTVDEGGELVFPSQNKSVKTEEGKIVVFPPYGMFSHYTTPSNQPREVVVTWFLYTNYRVTRD